MSYLTNPFAVPTPPGAEPTGAAAPVQTQPAQRQPSAIAPDHDGDDSSSEPGPAARAPRQHREQQHSPGALPTQASAPDATGHPGETPNAAAPEEAAETPESPGVPEGSETGAEPDSVAGAGEAEAEANPPAIPLTAPRDGVPEVVQEEHALMAAAQALRAGTGPLAVDAERASGYRYGQRAYLVQLRREGAGTWLIDPVGCPDLSPISEATADVEWILHAATQDLPCLREVGMVPHSLFDTELGARLAGLPRVGLAAVIEHYLGYSLAKEHSAVDWSTRPLPEPWLRYATLDVELLAELREATREDLARQGKLEWALEEFAALTHFSGPPVRVDPWRRTSGLHKMRSRRAIAVIRELWYARDDIARQRDISPGRILPDATLLAIGQATPSTPEQLTKVSTQKAVRRHQREWLAAVQRAAELPEEQLPVTSLPSDGPPPQRAWADRDPIAAARLTQARAELMQFAEDRHVPVENLLTPDLLRRVLWNPPGTDEAVIDTALQAGGARAWQRGIAAPIIARACRDHA
ncbi:HRDC domain-containing protein [Gephyromycinifex aptenodytis]|uniref:HRDC domain-containing protein n=1 Tax=Gephyromycinifex aptenodytis TaxID=2716227 RepID=UPI001445843F|nr:ribonuclease D [Gephyromycinifex aptenodytis]